MGAIVQPESKKRKFEFPSFEPPNFITTFMIVFVIIPALIGVVFSTMNMIANSWTGTGTVIDQGHIPASEGSFMNCGMIGVGVPCFFQDTSSPESWFIKVREDNGAEHSFPATQEQYDAAKLGESYTKR